MQVVALHLKKLLESYHVDEDGCPATPQSRETKMVDADSLLAAYAGLIYDIIVDGYDLCLQAKRCVIFSNM